ncbi:hypothetical protein [Bradyrhizobium sp. 33ap4]|uniref:hypothetical protein n=1 Tax=Bradyrhizobium sp. 33ap4 TaxID=3061630 RepID=UPI002931E75D|nr:hypothetical protein [Bradyrhizobium sp. 33ap4]
MTTSSSIEKQETAHTVEPFGYLWPREGGVNGYYFITPAQFEHVEERFRSLYKPVFDSPPEALEAAWRKITVLEECRRDDLKFVGVGEQVLRVALNELWRLLGANNQTEAVMALRKLPPRPCTHFPKADDVCLVCNPHKAPQR